MWGSVLENQITNQKQNSLSIANREHSKTVFGDRH